MLLSLRAAADVVNEQLPGRAASSLSIGTSMRVDLRASSQPSALAIGTSLIVGLTHAPQPGSSLTISTGVAVSLRKDSIPIGTSMGVSLTAGRTASRLTIGTGPLRVTANGAALRLGTAGARVSLMAGRRGSALTIRTGVNVALTASGNAFGFTRDLVIAAQSDLTTISPAVTELVLLGIEFTDPDFASVDNGGRIRQTNAEDVQFALIDATGDTGTVLFHNIVSHDPVLGRLIFDIKLPSWNVTSDVPIRMSYGFVGQMTGRIAISTGVTVGLTAGTAAPANLTLPAISPTSAVVGTILSCSQGTWRGTQPISYAYQWRRGAADIAGQTNPLNYTTVTADVGAANAISCRVTATNSVGSTPQISGNSVVVTATATVPVNQIPPHVTPEAAAVGATLTCSQGMWLGTEPISYAYRWRRGTANIGGALGANATYLTIAADQGQAISCQVTASNSAGTGVPVISDNSVTVTAASAFVRLYPMEVDNPGGRTITRPSVNTNTGNVYNIPANTIVDLRGTSCTLHVNSSSATSWTINGGAANSVICGGRAFSPNVRYSGTVDGDAWGNIHGDTSTGGGASGNYPALRITNFTEGFKIQGFYGKQTMDGISANDWVDTRTRRVTVENCCFVEMRDDAVSNDGQGAAIYHNCYFQGHVWLSWAPGDKGPPGPANGPPDPKRGTINTFENCLIDMDRMRWLGHNDQGVRGSKRTNKYFSPTNRNNGIIINGSGMGHKHPIKGPQGFGYAPDGKAARVIMRNCLMRITTPPVDPYDHPLFPTNATGGNPDMHGSTYENVHICWLGPALNSTGGPGPWPFEQSIADLAELGIIVEDGSVSAAEELRVHQLWETTKAEWFAVNGYDEDTDTFSWNRR